VATEDNFYDKWLKFWDDSQEQKKSSRAVIHEEELEWVETPQDYRIALMAGPENGFRTWGSEVTIADIPAGSHTGKHEHGEEGIYIVEGEGFSVINGVRYDWETGSVLWIPFGGQHQHFNTSSETARYLSFTALHLEHFAGLGKLDQIEVKGFTDTPVEAEISLTGLDPQGRRVVLKKDDAPILTYDPEEMRAHDAPMLDVPVEAAISRPDGQPGAETGSHRDWSRMYMGMTRAGQRLGRSDTGFRNQEIEISNSMGDMPGRHGGLHAHMEAFLYIIDGEGYTLVDGDRVDWKKGSLVHVQGPQTHHQHYNTGDKPTAQLRLAPGLRFNFFQHIARERFPYLVWGGRGEMVERDRLRAAGRSGGEAHSHGEEGTHGHGPGETHSH
jgi:uncharacterized cupin superfamily protein